MARRMRAKVTPDRWDAVTFGGVLVVCGGVAMLSPAAAVILAGAVVAVLGILGGRK